MIHFTLFVMLYTMENDALKRMFNTYGPEEDIPVQLKIIIAAVNCIERDGIQNLTTRSIAAEAVVNSAAINYYFGTKEKLLDAIMDFTLEGYFQDVEKEILDKDIDDPRHALRTILEYTFIGMSKYPNLVKAHLYEPLINGNYDIPFIERYNEQLRQITEKLASRLSAGDEKKIRLSVVQVFSSIIIMGLMPQFFANFLEADFRNHDKQQEYIDNLLDSFFPEK